MCLSPTWNNFFISPGIEFLSWTWISFLFPLSFLAFSPSSGNILIYILNEFLFLFPHTTLLLCCRSASATFHWSSAYYHAFGIILLYNFWCLLATISFCVIFPFMLWFCLSIVICAQFFSIHNHHLHTWCFITAVQPSLLCFCLHFIFQFSSIIILFTLPWFFGKMQIPWEYINLTTLSVFFYSFPPLLFCC